MIHFINLPKTLYQTTILLSVARVCVLIYHILHVFLRSKLVKPYTSSGLFRVIVRLFGSFQFDIIILCDV